MCYEASKLGTFAQLRIITYQLQRASARSLDAAHAGPYKDLQILVRWQRDLV